MKTLRYFAAKLCFGIGLVWIWIGCKIASIPFVMGLPLDGHEPLPEDTGSKLPTQLRIVRIFVRRQLAKINLPRRRT